MLVTFLTLALNFGPYCDHPQSQWEQAGLDAPCSLLNPARPGQHLGTLMQHWALNEEQARCALDALNAPNTDAWRSCVARWPESKPLWVGLLTGEEFRPIGDLIAKLSPALANELYRLSFGPHAELALQILRSQPHRFSDFVPGPEGFPVALATWVQRRSTLNTTDRESVLLLLVAGSIARGDLVLAAEFWMELPESRRATLRDSPLPGKDQRVRLAMGLLVAGFREEAGRIPLEGDPLLAELVTWSLTGKRTTSPWDAAIATLSKHELRGGDFYAALYPFIAPHFVLHDVRPLLAEGFNSHIENSSASAAIIRSARAKSFLRMKALEGMFASTPTVTEQQAKEITSALGRRRDSLKIYVNGPDHAFIVASTAWYRTDRDASGKLQVTTLEEWIH